MTTTHPRADTILTAAQLAALTECDRWRLLAEICGWSGPLRPFKSVVVSRTGLERRALLYRFGLEDRGSPTWETIARVTGVSLFEAMSLVRQAVRGLHARCRESRAA